jgi:ribonuclease BN (tRNA processing enzyme)
MKLTVLGSSGGAPTRINPASGYLVEAGSDTVWIDAGTGTFMPLAARIDPGQLSAVVLSHLHVDHCTDIFGLYGYLAFGPSGTVPVPVYLPEGGAEHLADFARAGAEHVFHSVLDVITVGPGDTVSVGGATLTFGAAVHPVPALVTRLTAAGVSMTYSGDTGPGSDLVELATGSDLLLCEASLAGERSDAAYPYHLTATEAGGAAAAADVDRLVITHLVHTVDAPTAVTEASTAFGRPVEIAVPGAIFEIGANQ